MGIKHFKTAEFDAAVAAAPLAMVDFWADWCGPCKMLSPVIESLADQYEGKVLVGKVNVDEEPDLARRFGVMSIPTVVFLKNCLLYTSPGPDGPEHHHCGSLCCSGRGDFPGLRGPQPVPGGVHHGVRTVSRGDRNYHGGAAEPDFAQGEMKKRTPDGFPSGVFI